MIDECKNKAYEERLKTAGFTDLETRRTRADMLEVFKILSGNKGLQSSIFFKRRAGITRGHSLKLFKPGCHRDV
jgi:hypothetical protein